MANDFSQDANCKAVWNLESGAVPFLADSKGGNTLTNDGTGEDTGDYKQGSCSGDFVRADADNLYINDADLDSGFPFKSGESNKTFSVAFWFKTTDVTATQYLVSKPYVVGDDWSWTIQIISSSLYFRVSSTGASLNGNYSFDTALENNTWYHICVTYDGDGDDSYRIRIWDDTAQAQLGDDKTGTALDIYLNTAPFYLSYNLATYALNGNLDEVVVFDDVLSVADIDQIRGGTYPGAVDVTVYPDTLELALTQETSTVAWDSSVLPTTLALSLTQHIPDVFGGTVITPATFELALTQHAPAVQDLESRVAALEEELDGMREEILAAIAALEVIVELIKTKTDKTPEAQKG